MNKLKLLGALSVLAFITANVSAKWNDSSAWKQTGETQQNTEADTQTPAIEEAEFRMYPKQQVGANEHQEESNIVNPTGW